MEKTTTNQNTFLSRRTFSWFILICSKLPMAMLHTFQCSILILALIRMLLFSLLRARNTAEPTTARNKVICKQCNSDGAFRHAWSNRHCAHGRCTADADRCPTIYIRTLISRTRHAAVKCVIDCRARRSVGQGYRQSKRSSRFGIGAAVWTDDWSGRRGLRGCGRARSKIKDWDCTHRIRRAMEC
jgi:hypothetical protein